MTTPAQQFFKYYDSFLSKAGSARQAYDQAWDAFNDKFDYELYASYASFKSVLSRRRKRVDQVNRLQPAN